MSKIPKHRAGLCEMHNPSRVKRDSVCKAISYWVSEPEQEGRSLHCEDDEGSSPDVKLRNLGKVRRVFELKGDPVWSAKAKAG